MVKMVSPIRTGLLSNMLSLEPGLMAAAPEITIPRLAWAIV